MNWFCQYRQGEDSEHQPITLDTRMTIGKPAKPSSQEPSGTNDYSIVAADTTMEADDVGKALQEVLK